MVKKKKTKIKPGTPDFKKRNPFLNRSGGFNLVDRFPTYQGERDKKQKKE